MFYYLQITSENNLTSIEIDEDDHISNIFKNFGTKNQLDNSKLDDLSIDLNDSIRDRMNIMAILIDKAIEDEEESIDKIKITKMALVITILKSIYKDIYSGLIPANENDFLFSLLGTENNNLVLEYLEDFTEESQFVNDANKIISVLRADKNKNSFNDIVKYFMENTIYEIRHPGLKYVAFNFDHIEIH